MAGPAASTHPRLTMHGISRRFGATVALDSVDLAVAAGEVHALIGENGAGKSTLVRVLAGATRADSGSMTIDGADYAPHRPADGRSAGVAMIHQELSLAPHLSVMENILLGAEPRAGPFLKRRESRRLAAGALRTVGRSDIPLAARAGRLPPAERQLVEIARGVALRCRVLVLDEPTSSLARRDVEHLFDLIRRMAEAGCAVIYISHVLEEVFEIAGAFTVLRDGRVAGRGRIADTTVPAIVSMMVGREVREFYPRSPRRPADVVLKLGGLAGARLPRDASLSLRRGEVLGIAGLLGAGRTELLRAVFGLDPVKRGEIRVAGWSGPASPGRRWARGVGMVSEDRAAEGIAGRLDVAENVVLPRVGALSRLGIITPERRHRMAREWIERLSIRCGSSRQPAWTLSGGNQQKVAFARLLAAGADVLLLDEPTRGIDVGAKAGIYRLIDDLASRADRPCAVLVVSSHLPELLGMCDRIAVMRNGRLGPARAVSELGEHGIMLEATGSAAP